MNTEQRSKRKLRIWKFYAWKNGCLAANYNCLEFKNSLSFSIPLLLKVLNMEKPDDDFLKFFLLNMGAPKIMALLVPVHFMFKGEILTEGFVLKKEY